MTPQDELTDHAYDGIQEYDNPIPGWWSWLFIATIVFSFIYAFIALLTPDMSPEAGYQRAMVDLTRKQFGEIDTLEPGDAAIASLMSDERWLRAGRAVYGTHCVNCHAAEGTGGTGPNLTDRYMLHITKLADIYDVILNGRNGGAMPQHRTVLSKPELLVVSAYVASLFDTNKPGGIAPQGKEIKGWATE